MLCGFVINESNTGSIVVQGKVLPIYNNVQFKWYKLFEKRLPDDICWFVSDDGKEIHFNKPVPPRSNSSRKVVANSSLRAEEIAPRPRKAVISGPTTVHSRRF
jgi:hypothetical protein